MENLTINQFDITSDLDEIKSWKTKYNQTDGYKLIKHFILDDSNTFTLDRLIKSYHEEKPIGNNEKNTILSLKNNNELLGFIIVCELDLNRRASQAIIEFVVINPEHQRTGVAYNAINELVYNSDFYLSKRASEFRAFISGKNIPSLSLFKKLGFNVSLTNPQFNFYKATKLEPNLEFEQNY